MWAGFSGRDEIGSPLHDVEVELTGSDRFVPSAVAGLLIAPANTSFELGASVAWAATARIDADVFAVGTQGGPSVAANGSATLPLEHPVTMRAGGRYLGDRFVVELGGELDVAPRRAANHKWTIEGMRVIDPTGVEVPLEVVPSRISMRTHGSIRGALDVELLAGFLWATTGYAYSVGSVAVTKQSPIFGDLGGHTVGLGLEGTSGGFTLTLGWSRTWSVARNSTTQFALDNPFNAGDGITRNGRYDGSIDQLGILLDAELDPN
jgi:hypothetical protein